MFVLHAGQSAIDSAASHKAVDLLVASLGWKDQALAAAGALAIGHLGLQGPVLLSTPSEKRPQPDGPPPAAAAAAADAAAPMDVEREEAEPVAAASNTGCSAAAIERIAALLKSRDAQVQPHSARLVWAELLHCTIAGDNDVLPP